MIPLRDSTPSQNFPVITILLIVVNILVFLFENSLPPAALDQLVDFFGLIPARVRPGALVTLSGPVLTPFFSSMFMHGGWLHLISNMWALWLFGDNVEDRMGPFRFMIFYLLCGLAAGCSHVLVNPASDVPTIGASGAIAGVMGAYFLLFPTARILTLVPIIVFFWMIEIPAFIYLGFWIILQVLQGTAYLAGGASQIAFWAHIGGFAAGMILFRFFLRSSPPRRRAY